MSLRRQDAVRDSRSAAPTGPAALDPLIRLMEEVEERHEELRHHGERVAEHAAAIATEMGLPRPAINRVRIAARLHDLGKVSVPAEILAKPGPLTSAEWRQVHRHPKVGADLLAGAEMHDLATIVGAHHERPDGAGYPHSVPASETPLEAQIVAVADAFDAMISPRPYRPPLSREEAFAELERVAGTQLDPIVVDAFMRTLQRRRAA